MRADSDTQPDSTQQSLPISRRWLVIFEERHGAGAYERLCALLERPCVSYAPIAQRFSVSRECVRQWHKLLMPDAPRGHARQRLCAQLRQRKRLLSNRLFRSFFTHARRLAPGRRLDLVSATTGYRAQLARLDGRLVALREAQRPTATLSPASRVFMIVAYRGPAEFVYVWLEDDDYLFVPAALLSFRLLLAVDSPEGLGGTVWRRSFTALDEDARAVAPGEVSAR